VAYKRWGNQETVEQNPIQELFKLYVKFHEEVKVNPPLDDEARAWFKRLDRETMKLKRCGNGLEPNL